MESPTNADDTDSGIAVVIEERPHEGVADQLLQTPKPQCGEEALRRWMEVELAGPLRFNVTLARELREAQRSTEFLLAENNLLRKRQMERQQLMTELHAQHNTAMQSAMDILAMQQQHILRQQNELLRALKVFTISFQVGGALPPPRPPTTSFFPPPGYETTNLGNHI